MYSIVLDSLPSKVDITVRGALAGDAGTGLEDFGSNG